MAEFVIGRLKFVWRSAWTTATLYRKDDVVRYGGKSYVATANHTASADFYTDTANWDLMTDGQLWNNEWTPALSGTKIKLGDIYRYGNNVYICITQHDSSTIFDFSKFDLFVPGVTWQDSWQDAYLYQLNDLVKYGNNIYICIEQHTSSGDIDYSKFDLFLPGLNFEDSWDVATNYQTGDIVTYGGYTYVAEQDSVGEIPYNNSANWKVLTTGYSYQNVWSNATAYKTGDVVRYGGNTYVAKADTTAGQLPTLTAFWDLLTEGLSFKGTWSVTTQYLIGEVVEYSTNSYRAIQDSIGNQPDTSPAFWQIVAQGDSAATLTTQGDLLTHNGTQLDRIPRGAVGSELTVDTNNDLAWTGVSTTVLHVAKTGVDTNPGTKTLPFLTIKHACSQASSGDVIFVEQGVYEEDLPIQVPAGVSLYGDSLRGCEVRPQTGDESETMFLLNDSVNIRNFKFTGLNNGVVMALDPAGAITTASPYIQNCTSVNTGSIGIKIDGSVQASGYHSILANDFTQINSDGVGVHVSNGGRGEMVSVFTYYCDKGFFAETGGFIRALNCSSAYGEYGAVADGNNPNETALTVQTRGEQLRYQEASLTGTLNIGDTITGANGATADIIRVIDSTQRIKITNIQNGPFTDGEACTTNGGAGFTLAVTNAQSGQTGYLFEISGTPLQSANAITLGSNIRFDGDTTYYTITAVTNEDLVNGYATVRINPEKTAGTADANPTFITSQFSNIRLTGHDFLDIGTGDFATTNYPNTPTQAAQQDREISETNGGRVYYVSTDQSGNFRVGEYFRVDQATGNATLNADAFDLSGLTELQLGSIGAQLGATINEFSTDQNLTGNSNTAVPTESAVKGYVDDQIANNAFQINKESAGSVGLFAKVETKDDDTIEFKIKDALEAVIADGYMIVPKGTTAERPNPASVGTLRFNTDINQLEQYTTDGWQGISAPPTISNVSVNNVDETADPQTIVITGQNFDITATASLVNANGTTVNPTTSVRDSSSQITITFTGGDRLDGTTPEPLDVKVLNGSGLSAILEDSITVDATPVWTTPTGSVGECIEDVALSPTITLVATDPESAGSLTYSITSGALPTGLSLDTNTGVISGTPNVNDTYTASGVTHNFTVTADDGTGNTTPQAFSILRTWQDGSSAAKAGTSAQAIVNSTGITTNGVYWINIPGGIGAQQIYCIMDPAWAGGGWMIAANHRGGATPINTGHQPRITAVAGQVGNTGTQYQTNDNFSVNLQGQSITEVIHVAYSGGNFANYAAYYRMGFNAFTLPTGTNHWYQLTTSGGTVIGSLADRRLYTTQTGTHNAYRPYSFGCFNSNAGPSPGTVGSGASTQNYPNMIASWNGNPTSLSAAATFSWCDSSNSTGWDDYQDGSGMGDGWGVENVGANAYRDYASWMGVR